MKLRSVVIIDPIEGVAEFVARQCGRLADDVQYATDGAAGLELAEKNNSEMVVLSLEVLRPEATDVAVALSKLPTKPLIVATYRELGVPGVAKFGKLGVQDFVAQPVDATEVFRAASRYFNLPFRRHDRFKIELEVARADGVLIGQTVDISEGGMMMSITHAVTPGESLLLNLALPDEVESPLRIRCSILRVDGRAPAPMAARIQFDRLRGNEHRRLVEYLEGLGRGA